MSLFILIIIIIIIILVWESMMKGGYFGSQTTIKAKQELTDPLGKCHNS